MRGALCVATRLYILYLAADESISGWEFLLLIPKSPQEFQVLLINTNNSIQHYSFINTQIVPCVTIYY